MDLAQCETCGFFWNTTFDVAQTTYDTEYESTQMHSRVFREYLKQTALDWLQSLDTPPRSILEVGCGQGEFLTTLAELTQANLLGFDPAFRPDGANPVQIIPKVLPAKPTATFDLVVNRMTLEHIAAPQDFLANLFQWVAPGGTMITQVPNAGRIISEQHVYELFYEHVNYFTQASLLHALQRAGFNDNRAEVTYGDQHLTIFSRRGPSPVPAASASAPGLQNTLPASLQRFTAHWNQILKDRHTSGRDVWIWGTGSRATTFLSFVSAQNALHGAIDINPLREGSYVLGTACKTFLPQALENRKNLSIIVMNPIYKDEIAEALGAISAEAELLLIDDF
jgi:SAM-dependent methyltransferase